MPSLPQPWRREISVGSQSLSEPTVETPISLPLRSATEWMPPSLATMMAKPSGGPASVATPFVGEPLAMNIISMPEPSSISALPASSA